jgi:hypothetical protein
MKTTKTEKRLRTVELVEERIQALQMRVLTRIERLDWRGARRLSAAIGRCIRRKVEIQNKLVKELPLFKKRGAG